MKVRHIIVLAAMLLVLCACDFKRDGTSDPQLVPVQLAVSVGMNPVSTKGDASRITEMKKVFRGMTNVTLVPFDVRRHVEGDDVSIFHPCYLGGISPDFESSALEEDGRTLINGLVSNINAHVYSNADVNLPAGTSAVLAYGYPKDAGEMLNDIQLKHLNGALAVSGLAPQTALRSASDISFAPVPIYPDGLPPESQSIVRILNYLMSGASTTLTFWYYKLDAWVEEQVSVSWNESIGDTRLKEWFLWMTNNGHLTSSAAGNVEYMLTYIYDLLQDYNGSSEINNREYKFVSGGQSYIAYKRENGDDALTYADIYNALRDELLNRFSLLQEYNDLVLESTGNNSYFVRFHDDNIRVYPGSYGLPDGAAVIKWNGVEWTAVSEVLDGVAPVSSYCYPPKLWYYANTLLSTATKENEEVYTSAKASWSNVILNSFTKGKVIQSSTKSVALDDPLEYSCGMLVATVQATANYLRDASGDTDKYVHVTESNMPVTGVIIGSQRSLCFDFSPMSTGNEYFLYDNCIDGVYLYNPTSSAPEFRTLVSETPEGGPVYFSLELRNNTGVKFTGADGVVLPGAKFYLLGIIEPPGSGSAFKSVFQRDYSTSISCKVTSLKEARTAVPDLEHPQLSMGVQVDVNWKLSQPEDFVLY